jgi:nucleotide-binding universal stress UspA family protein
MKILIAYDGSDCARDAISDLRLAGLPDQAEVVVMSVADVWLPPPSSYEMVEASFEERIRAGSEKTRARARLAVEKARDLAEEAAALVRSNFPAWRVSADASAGSPAWEIIQKADAWEPDLIVVGSHGRTAVGRFFLGSVSQRIVNEARSSVRVARRLAEVRSGPVRIAIGVDGFEGSQAAVSAVAGRKWPEGSEARLVAALDLMMALPPEGYVEFNEDQRAWVSEVVEASAQKLRATGLAVSSLIKTADPKRLIVEEAERWRADSIFLGARGLRRIERVLIGSVSAAVAAGAHCTVEIVRVASWNSEVQNGKDAS